MEVNRLNPTKSIRIGGISHFAFVNGWLLRGWGVAVSQTMRRKRASAPVAWSPLLAPTVLKVDGDLSVAAMGIRARTMEQREAKNRPNAHH